MLSTIPDLNTHYNGIPEAGVEVRIMTIRKILLNELRKTKSLLEGPSGLRPHTTSLQPAAVDILPPDLEEVRGVKPYSEVPGPRELPIVGNAWRFLPYIGKWCRHFFNINWHFYNTDFFFWSDFRN
jgi:hypothetical protein